jgi:hypothetical protein
VVRTATSDYLTTSPWILTFIIFVFGPVVALRLITLYYTDPAPHWRVVYPYEYAFNRNVFDLDLSGPLSFDLSWPWPQYQGHSWLVSPGPGGGAGESGNNQTADRRR